jgi:hypothetical protein
MSLQGTHEMRRPELYPEEIAAGEQLARDFAQFATVDALFWLKLAEHKYWNLYLATSLTRVSYKDIGQLFAEHEYRWLDFMKIKLVDSTDPLSIEVMKIRDHLPMPRARDYDGGSIAGTAIDDAYIYPPFALSALPT